MKKKFFSVVLVLIFTFSLCNIAFAQEQQTLDMPVFTLTNNQTGESCELEVVTESVVRHARSGGDSELTVGYSAFAPIPSPQPRSEAGNGKSEGGVRISFWVVYYINSTREKIQVSRIYGNWTPDSDIYLVNNREVGVHAGLDGIANYGSLKRYPTSNSFSYSTGWGYVNFVTSGDGSPFAWADAILSVVGMPGTHTLECGFAFPDSR